MSKLKIILKSGNESAWGRWGNARTGRLRSEGHFIRGGSTPRRLDTSNQNTQTRAKIARGEEIPPSAIGRGKGRDDYLNEIFLLNVLV